jgi:hypothetical protein
MRRTISAAIVLLATLTMSCNQNGSTQTVTAPTATGSTSVFSGSLVTGGTATRSFEAALSGTATATFEFLDQGGVSLQLGMGIPRVNNSGCFLSRAITVAPAAGSPLSMPVEPGTFCVQLADTGGQVARVAAFRVTISAP